MERLAEQVVLITGAGRGLGGGIARGLASYGATILAVSRTKSELDSLAERVRGAGGKIETFPLDLGQPSAIDAFLRDVLARHGRIDTLINNAAILRNTRFDDISAEEFDETIAVNLLAPVRLIRGVLPAMRSNGRGSIINVSSRAGVDPFANETDYCAAKYGLEGFSFSLALELQPDNISVNVVTPGFPIKPTSITVAEFENWDPERRARFRDPIGMADGFAFLALQDGSGVTGQRFNAYELSENVRNMGWDWNRHI
ncbi:MAG TPA: SDR family oxidoreductase [Nitrolancea sp.]|nr:SDR family oxidoreductase [Nitrolancea sp.]